MPKNILVINSSPNGANSLSRKVTAETVAQLQAKYPGSTVKTRDLDKSPLPHLTGEVVAAFFTPPDSRSAALAEAVRLSDKITDELLAADIIVIGAPMWNFNVPSVLKAWIDHIVRAGRTFSFSPTGYEGLVKGKTAYLALSRGGKYAEAPYKQMEFHETYLRSVLGFIGITDVHAIIAEGASMGPDGPKNAIASAEQQLAAAIQKAA
ncbi:MAG: FMN-dependent NADH-azoreductase [Alphaproteobacteria bacterium]|nr:FMN-dependent NADH-azoreductase [Alphaproteobacteria bacterium]